jgi:hypothetical protein
MARLQKYVRSEADCEFMSGLAESVRNGDFDECDGESFMVTSGLTPKRIVEAYLATGEFFDIDCPGGIEQMVKDYREGKFDE